MVTSIGSIATSDRERSRLRGLVTWVCLQNLIAIKERQNGRLLDSPRMECEKIKMHDRLPRACPPGMNRSKVFYVHAYKFL